jgi:hypothetical protein
MSSFNMSKILLNGIFILSKCTNFIIVVALLILCQFANSSSWAESKPKPATSLQEIIKIALDINSKGLLINNSLPSEDITFLVKKNYFQIQTKLEQLATAKEVRGHFQKAVKKSKESFEKGDGVISQSDITKLKLGLSDILNNIADLEYDLQIARLDLGNLINQELKSNSEIGKVDPFPIKFVYNSFEDFLRAKNYLSKTKKPTAGRAIFSNIESVRLSETNELILYKAYIAVKTLNVKVKIGKKNRKITRALITTEAANYDFGIGNSKALFEALIIYTRVFSSYLDSVYTFNLAVANLEKLNDSTYKAVDKLN